MAKKTELRGPVDAVDRLETNIKVYIEKILAAMQVEAEILVSTDTEPPDDTGLVVKIDASSTMQTIDMGAAYRSEIVIEVLGQIDSVPAKSHKAITSAIYDGIWDIRPDVRLLHASRKLLDAVNRVPGKADRRPCSGIHLRDIRDPSRNMVGRDFTASTILTGTATFQPGDWPSDVRPDWW